MFIKLSVLGYHAVLLSKWLSVMQCYIPEDVNVQQRCCENF
jgi:hypothetical protein